MKRCHISLEDEDAKVIQEFANQSTNGNFSKMIVKAVKAFIELEQLTKGDKK